MFNEEEFEALMAEKQYSEIKALIEKILQAINEKNNTDILKSADKISYYLKELLNQEPNTPQVNVNVDIEGLKQTIIKSMDDLKSILLSKKQWEFTFERGVDGLIESIKAVQV